METESPSIDHLSRMASALNSMRKSKVLTDFTIACDNIHSHKVKFPVHRAVLASCSEYWKNFFEKHPDEKGLKITKVPANMLETLLEFVYTGQLRVPDYINIGTLLDSANHLHLPLVVHKCAQMMLNTISNDNIIDLMKAAQDHRIDHMKPAISKYLHENLKNLIDLDIFDQVPLEYVKDVVSQPVPNCSSDEIFEAVLEWIEYDEFVRKENGEAVLSSFDVDTMSTDYLLKIYENPDLLDKYGLTKSFYQAISKRMNNEGLSETRTADENLISTEDASSARDEPKSKIIGFVKHERSFSAIFYRIAGGRQESLTESATFPFKEGPLTSPLHASVCVHHDQVFIIGGGTYVGEPLATTYVFSTRTKQWERRSDMYQGRLGAGSAVLNDVIYIVGGEEFCRILSTVERYSIESDKWIRLPPMPVCLSSPAVCAFQNDVYVLGNLVTEESVALQKYDPRSKRWTMITTQLPVPKARVGRSAVHLTALSGRLFAVRRWYDTGSDSRQSFYEFYPTSKRWISHHFSWINENAIAFLDTYNDDICIVDYYGNAVLYSPDDMKIHHQFQLCVPEGRLESLVAC